MQVFETLIIGLLCLNFYLKLLHQQSHLSLSTDVPESTVGVIVHRGLVIAVIHNSTKEKRTKKENYYNSNTGTAK